MNVIGKFLMIAAILLASLYFTIVILPTLDFQGAFCFLLIGWIIIIGSCVSIASIPDTCSRKKGGFG